MPAILSYQQPLRQRLPEILGSVASHAIGAGFRAVLGTPDWERQECGVVGVAESFGGWVSQGYVGAQI